MKKIENDKQSITFQDIVPQYPSETAKKYQLAIIDLFKDLMKIDVDKKKIMDVYCWVI